MRTAAVFLALTLLMINCTCDTVDKGEPTECAIDSNIKSKETATALIVGKWNWIKTTRTSRGIALKTETPLSTQKTLTFEFTGEKVRILENNTLTEEQYEIALWDEGANPVDTILVVRFFKLTGDFQGTSMLLLNTSGTCLTLVNSYNDAGDDLHFKRVD